MRLKRLILPAANKPSELAGYSVCTTCGLRDNHFYVLNVYRHKLAYPDLKRAMREQHRLFNATSILVEDKASGTQLIKDLIKDRLSKIVRVTRDGGKIMWLHAQTATIENGFVHIPTSAHWLGN